MECCTLNVHHFFELHEEWLDWLLRRLSFTFVAEESNCINWLSVVFLVRDCYLIVVPPRQIGNEWTCRMFASFVRLNSSILLSLVFDLKPLWVWASLSGLLNRWNESLIGAGFDWPSVPGNELKASSGCWIIIKWPTIKLVVGRRLFSN